MSPSEKIHEAMNSISDYRELVGVMSAHVQRMICDQAQNDAAKAEELAHEFHQLCMAKIGWLSKMAAGRA